MAKIKITLTIELGEHYDLNEHTELEWLKELVLDKDNLYFHSNEIGDEVGKVTNVENFEILKK